VHAFRVMRPLSSSPQRVHAVDAGCGGDTQTEWAERIFSRSSLEKLEGSGRGGVVSGCCGYGWYEYEGN